MNQLTVGEVCRLLDELAPWELTESWDNTGLLAGNPEEVVDSILVGLDPTPGLLQEALESGANLVITHHPLIFHPLKNIQSNSPGCQAVAFALRREIHCIACHTNLDAARGGVNDILASGLGLIDTRPLVAAVDGDGCGLGRLGRLDPPCTPDELLGRLRRLCQPPWLLGAGSPPARISRVAVCGGSCSDLIMTAAAAGAEVFVTSEIKHAAARLAEEAGIWLLDGGHFATEMPAMRELAIRLEQALRAGGHRQVVHTSRQQAPLTLL